jgi:3-methyladenine DNA glycosylase AlkC
MFIPQFVERYGMQDWETSVPALERLTRYGSSEFAVRPFIKQDQARMLTTMLDWAENENYHVRRLATEGCRPRLPWAMALPELKRDPAPILPILEKLKDDPEEYVRRSTANNLNDISKDHPNLVLSMAESWLGANAERDRLVKHACRTLLKAGNTKAMALFGFAAPDDVAVANLRVQETALRIGKTAHFAFDVVCKNPCHLRLEYAIEFVKAKGKRSRKVFKISERDYPAGTTAVKRHQSMRDLSTRKHYPGRHGLFIHVNGHPMAETTFHLET